MTLQYLMQWWNLVFITPFLIALLYLGLYILSGLSLGSEPGADGDAGDGDSDSSIEHDFDADADSDADGHDAEHDAQTHESVTHGSSSGTLLAFLGIGKLPISFLIMILFLTWGVIGFGLNNILYPKLNAQNLLGLLPSITLPIAGFGSILATSWLARMSAKLIRTDDGKAIKRHELLGLTGKAVLPIGSEFGMAQVRDAKGDLYEISCRMAAGTNPVEKGAKVRLVGYNANLRLYFVEACE
jgi:hypothetical protein